MSINHDLTESWLFKSYPHAGGGMTSFTEFMEAGATA